MKHKNSRAILVSLLMAISVIAIGATPAAAQAQDDINVVLEPTDGEVQPDGTIDYDVVVEGADNDLSAYTVDIEIGDTAVAEISDYELGADVDSVLADGSTVAEDGSSATLEVAMGDANVGVPNPTIATLTVSAGPNEGSTTIEAVSASVKDNDANVYSVDTLGSADVAVTAGGGDGGDGGDGINVLLEPADGEIPPEGETTYDVVLEGVDNDLNAYTVDIEVGDTAVAEISDYELGADVDNVLGDNTDVADDGSSASISVAMGDNDVGVNNATVATLTMSAGPNEGSTTIETVSATAEDNDGNEYGISTLDSKQVNVVGPNFPVVIPDEKPAKDLNGDGFPEDVNGDGEFNIFDMSDFFNLLKNQG